MKITQVEKIVIVAFMELARMGEGAEEKKNTV